ncbi:FkbM family methyltransferase [Sinorhizobium numidicum]|uniref:FkbM family methyltransferase n=1 Tax=Sinorhizobium numidicum TaxID=680248 RepID=A0ABY8CQS0_9HYPH|nr:FkbM family methyltransferase [Sinorhizobium numidicum]WEX75007.1 FkbM family methyltransferase [Sinorhizobium numidicum]WEX81001.1 FkbM family methyltransferase [Sinorhizobium numidicum]
MRCGPVLEFGFPSQVPHVLLAFGDFIDPEYAFLRKIYRPGWIVADVGAAIGQFSVFAATLPAAKVHAFEPSSANVAALSRNIVRNGVSDRVEVHRIAFSNAEFEANFETRANAWLSGISETGTELVSVRTLTADFRRLGLDHVSVLKINVAGYEPQVIEGADAFLAKGGADILILLLGLASLPWYARLAANGYRFFYFHPNENALYEVTAFDADSVLAHRPWPARNIIAIHQSAMESRLDMWLPVRRI